METLEVKIKELEAEFANTKDWADRLSIRQRLSNLYFMLQSQEESKKRLKPKYRLPDA